MTPAFSRLMAIAVVRWSSALMGNDPPSSWRRMTLASVTDVSGVRSSHAGRRGSGFFASSAARDLVGCEEAALAVQLGV
jgi:hypothetical protein